MISPSFIYNLVRLELEKINSNLYRDFEDPEIDDIFNHIAYTHIVSKYDMDGNRSRKGFEMSAKRKEDLASLVVEDYSDIVFDTSIPNKKTFIVPSDYMFYENSSCKVYYSDCKTISSTSHLISADYYAIPFKPGDINDFSGFKIQTTSGTDIFNNLLGANYIAPKDADLFIEYITSSELLLPGYKIYWEKSKDEVNGLDSVADLYIPDTLIVHKTQSNQPAIKYSFDGVTFITPIRATRQANYTTGTSNGANDIFGTIETQQGSIREHLKSTFRKPIPQEPLITRAGKTISIYTDGIFTVDRFYLTYIRKPKKISFSLQQGSNLPEHVIREIVSKVVTHIQSINQNPGYQLNQNEENKIVN